MGDVGSSERPKGETQMTTTNTDASITDKIDASYTIVRNGDGTVTLFEVGRIRGNRYRTASDAASATGMMRAAMEAALERGLTYAC